MWEYYYLEQLNWYTWLGDVGTVVMHICLIRISGCGDSIYHISCCRYRLKVSSVTDGTSVALIGMAVLTCWLAVAAVVTYMYSWSWEVELWSPVAVYAALGDSFTSLVLDWYATLSVMFNLFVFFLRHTNTSSKNDDCCCNATPIPMKSTGNTSFTIALVLCEAGVVEAAVVVTDAGGMATGSEGSFELER